MQDDVVGTHRIDEANVLHETADRPKDNIAARILPSGSKAPFQKPCFVGSPCLHCVLGTQPYRTLGSKLRKFLRNPRGLKQSDKGFEGCLRVPLTAKTIIIVGSPCEALYRNYGGPQINGVVQQPAQGIVGAICT